ncbi:site-specific DNA-methyltransferase [Patescibacteria group bacterium]|nr:site-specific DNA-methyltransferase [Patescibacteria group bacterium]MBU1721658.1 site-specific DNA-methyltransferase [Patescibacteria group bacterium]
MNGKSLNAQEELLAMIREKFPEIFTEGKIDCDRLKQTLGDEVEMNIEQYGMNWAGKSNCFRVIQEPTTSTLKPIREESVNFDATENLFIEGDNLDVLKVLQKSYYGKVKMIYIDPPYNTGNDFIYNDNFKQKKSDYEEDAGIVDDEGNYRNDGLMKNSKDRGHYHSDWLNMMYPRLFLARNLMKDDGVIFVSIDDNEVHNLRMIMNEIFGEENFLGSLIIQTATDNNPTQINTEHEYIICYAKDKIKQGFWIGKNNNALKIQIKYDELKQKYINNLNLIQKELRTWIKEHKNELPKVSHYDNVDKRGVFHDGDIANTKFGGYRYDVIHPETGKVCKIPDKGFRFPKETLDNMIKEDNILFGVDHNVLIKPKKRLENARDALKTMIYEDGRSSSKIVDNLIGRSVFNNPKSINILNRLCNFVVQDGDMILDFFAGSATTAHAVMALNAEHGGNRKCISVQLPELCDEKSEAYKAGYKTIADIAKERIRRAGKKIKEEKQLDDTFDLGFKVFKLEESNFKIWRNDVKDVEQLLRQMDFFVDNVKEDSTQENILYELVLKSGLDLNVSVEKKDVGNTSYFSINNGKLAICLENGVNKNLIDAILAGKPEKFICLDEAFGALDQLKKNTFLQMASAKIDFKVI